jgi:salicylate hydroxylase
MSSPSPFRVAIIGSGPIGKLLACTVPLHPRIQVVQYEAESLPLRPGFGYGVGPQGFRACKVASAEIGEALEKTCHRGPVWMRWWQSGTGGADELVDEVTMPDGQVHGWISRDDLMGLFDQWMHVGERGKQVGEVQYGKRLTAVTKDEATGLLQLSFQDGSKDEVNAIWAAEGIHSLCRQVLQGDAYQAPAYCGTMSFRGKVPVDVVRESLGEQFTKSQYMFIGTKGWHILTFPIEKGKWINIATFYNDPELRRKDREYKPTKDEILAFFPDRNKTADTMLNVSFSPPQSPRESVRK